MALDRLAKSDGNPLAIPVLVHHKQLIVSFRRVFSTRLLTLRATIVRPSPLRRATTSRYRSVGGDPARSEPTYAYAASGPIQSIVPAPTVIADSSIKENTTPYAAPVLCASLILLKPTPRLAKALFLDSPVSFCLLASSSLAAQPPCGEVTAQAFLGLRRHWSASAIKMISKSIL